MCQRNVLACRATRLRGPIIGLVRASVLLHEAVAWSMIAVAALVVVCVAGAKRFA